MNEYQRAELEVFKVVVKILEKYNLNYYAIGGTAIGAVRHAGFIPWDDDIDIAMPREDYEYFRTVLYKKLPSKYKLLDYDNCKEQDFLFTKVYDSETTMIDLYAKDTPSRYTGAFIDIMPVDGFPSDQKMQNYLLKRIILYSQLNRIRRIGKSTSKSWGIRAFRYICHLGLSLFSYNYFSNKIMLLVRDYKVQECPYTLFTWRVADKSLSKNRLFFSSSFFEKFLVHKFEDVSIKIPEEYDLYLKQDFGDYMTIPSEEQQQSGHCAWIYDMAKPVAYYKLAQQKGELK